MSEGRRPGGLTALAVVNFVLVGWCGLVTLGFIGSIALMMVTVDETAAEMQEMRQTLDEAGLTSGMIAFFATLYAITGLLLLLSGIGYLKQKAVLGRGIGSVYGIFGVVVAIWIAVSMPAEGGGGFQLDTIIGLIYPVLTLVLLNTTFKEDFVN